MKLLHIVNLSGLGGMEYLFTRYLNAAKGQQTQHLVAVKSTIHPALRGAIRETGATVYTLKHWCGVRIPGVLNLRRWRRRHVVSRVNVDRLVFWSTLPDAEWHHCLDPEHTEVVYYDHGKAWSVDSEALRAGLADVGSIVTVSRAGAALLREQTGTQRPIRVVPNGIPVSHDVGDRCYLPSGTLRIGFAGRLVAKKGLPIVLAAANRLAEQGIAFRLDVAGDGPEKERARSLIASYGLDDRVRLLGHQHDMAAFYRSIDVLAMPSIAEPFGLVALEAAAEGAVPLVANVDGMADTVACEYPELALNPDLDTAAYEAMGGNKAQLPAQVYVADRDNLRPPGLVDPAALADRLIEFATEPGRNERLGRDIQQHTRRHFGMGAYADALTTALTS